MFVCSAFTEQTEKNGDDGEPKTASAVSRLRNIHTLDRVRSHTTCETLDTTTLAVSIFRVYFYLLLIVQRVRKKVACKLFVVLNGHKV